MAITHLEIGGQDVTAHVDNAKLTVTQGAPWVLDHELTLLAQTESRPGADGWVERRRTDKVRAVCSCGYDSGLVARADLPTNDDLREHHHPRI